MDYYYSTDSPGDLTDPEDVVNRTDTVLQCQGSMVPALLYASLGPATCIIFVLSFLKRRKYRCLRCCNGRPAIVEPINLLDQYDNRWTYGAVFGAIPNMLISVFLGFDGQYFLQLNYPTYLKAIFSMVYVQMVGLSFFPLFACLNTDFKLTGSIIGFLYSLFWFMVKMQGMIQCVNPYPELYTHVTLVVNLPSNICLGIIVVRYFLQTLENIKNRSWSTHVKHKISPDHMILYVKKLLSKPKDGPDLEEMSTSKMIEYKLQAFIKAHIYDHDLPFKYSPRIVCVFTAVTMCTYLLGSLHFWVCSNFLEAFREYIIDFNNATEDIFRNQTYIGRNIQIIYNMIEYSWLVPSTLVSVLYCIGLVRVLIHYRNHTLRLYKGDRSFITEGYTLEPSKCIAFTVRFAGYQIAYMLWGQILFTMVGALFSLLICFFIVLPPMNGDWELVKWLAQVIAIPGLVSMVIYFLQDIAASLLFTQKKIHKDDHLKPLALDNISGFRTWDYFMFISNITVGLFSCLWRVLKSLLFGLLYLSRMDRSVLMAGFENSDVGFNAYIGMMIVELYNNHPVLRTFCHLVMESSPYKNNTEYSEHKDEDQQQDLRYGSNQTIEINCLEANEIVSEKRSLSLAAKRWHLAYTLINNPELIAERRTTAEEDEVSLTFFKKVMTKLKEDVSDLHDSLGSKLKNKLPLPMQEVNLLKDDTSLPGDSDIISVDFNQEKETLEQLESELEDTDDDNTLEQLNDVTDDVTSIDDSGTEDLPDKDSSKTSEAFSMSQSDQESSSSSLTNSCHSVIDVNPNQGNNDDISITQATHL